MATNTHVHTNRVVTTSGTVGGDVSVTATGTGRVGISEAIAGDATNQLLAIAFPVINLQAGKPLTWYTGGYFAIPLDQAVTSMYVTNASGSVSNLEIEALYDGTPP